MGYNMNKLLLKYYCQAVVLMIKTRLKVVCTSAAVEFDLSIPLGERKGMQRDEQFYTKSYHKYLI